MDNTNLDTETLSQNTVYTGIFFDPDTIYGKFVPKLKKKMRTPHVELKYKPTESQLFTSIIGKEINVKIVGYGINDNNEALLVEINSEEPAIIVTTEDIPTPNITLSVSEEGKPRDAIFLHYDILDEPVEVTGKYGLYSNNKVIDTQEKLQNR